MTFSKQHRSLFIGLLLVLELLVACAVLYLVLQAFVQPVIVTQRNERDEIFMLAAYGLAFKEWDGDYGQQKPLRGSNVAAVLVQDDKIVAYGLNREFEKRQLLYHAEMDLVLTYLDKLSHTQKNVATLEAATVYVTLEPCLMCFSTLRTLGVERIIYGERDMAHGSIKALQGSYMIHRPELIPAPTPFVNQLNVGFSHASTVQGMSLRKWLHRQAVKDIYQSAYCSLLVYKLRYTENNDALKNAQNFLQETPGTMPTCK